jgi:hypothetical protein
MLLRFNLPESVLSMSLDQYTVLVNSELHLSIMFWSRSFPVRWYLLSNTRTYQCHCEYLQFTLIELFLAYHSVRLSIELSVQPTHARIQLDTDLLLHSQSIGESFSVVARSNTRQTNVLLQQYYSIQLDRLRSVISIGTEHTLSSCVAYIDNWTVGLATKYLCVSSSVAVRTRFLGEKSCSIENVYV